MDAVNVIADCVIIVSVLVYQRVTGRVIMTVPACVSRWFEADDLTPRGTILGVEDAR